MYRILITGAEHVTVQPRKGIFLRQSFASPILLEGGNELNPHLGNHGKRSKYTSSAITAFSARGGGVEAGDG